MIWTHRGKPIPLEVYHGVPKGWYARDIVAEHGRMRGTHSLEGPPATEPGAPSWMPQRYEWLQYRETLYRVADGVRAGDAACVELAVRYIELRHIGSYSGFVRALLARRLKHAALTDRQRLRLHEHFASLVLDGERTEEFREYLALWRRFITPRQLGGLVAQLRGLADGQARVAWLLSRLRMQAASA
jgi:hypothetical protein